MNEIKIGDSVYTKNIMFLVDGIDPNTGEDIEMMFERWSRLTVIDITEDRYECKTQAGMIAYMDRNDIEL